MLVDPSPSASSKEPKASKVHLPSPVGCVQYMYIYIYIHKLYTLFFIIYAVQRCRCSFLGMFFLMCIVAIEHLSQDDPSSLGSSPPFRVRWDSGGDSGAFKGPLLARWREVAGQNLGEKTSTELHLNKKNGLYIYLFNDNYIDNKY